MHAGNVAVTLGATRLTCPISIHPGDSVAQPRKAKDMTQKDNVQTHDAPSKGSAVLSVLNAIDTGLGWLERVIVAGSVLVMAGLMSLHVVTSLLSNLIATYGGYPGLSWLKYFDAIIPSGIAGTYEVTEMLIVIMTFVGVGYAARCARHISMSAIYDQLSGRARKALLVLICVGTAVLMFYFAWKSSQYVTDLYGRGRVSSSLHIPMWTINLALPIGFTLAGVQYVLTTIRNLVSDDIYRSFTEKETYSDVPLDDSGQTHAADDDTNGI